MKKSHITINYREMRIECNSAYTRDCGNDKKEAVWIIDAYDKHNNHRGNWEFVFMRSDPHNSNPHEKFYLSNYKHLIKSGHDLVDRILSHH